MGSSASHGNPTTVSLYGFVLLPEADQLALLRQGKIQARADNPPAAFLSTLHYLIRDSRQCSLAVYDAVLALTSLEERSTGGYTPLGEALLRSLDDLAIHLIRKGASMGGLTLRLLHDCHVERVVPVMFEYGAGWFMNRGHTPPSGGNRSAKQWVGTRTPSKKSFPTGAHRLCKCVRKPSPETWAGTELQRSLTEHYTRFEQSVRNTLDVLTVVDLQEIVMNYLFDDPM